jgi:hypothetical protein
MEIRVSDPAFVFDLLFSLKRARYAVAQLTPHSLFVRVPHAANKEQARLHLGYYLANWRARHPGVVAEVIEPREPLPAA